MAEQKTMILSGVAQNVYGSFADAKADTVKGKLLFARVSGLTSGYDANGNLVVGGDANKSKTYVFMGKKCYGSFPQLPVELIKSLGITIAEANSENGISTSFADSPILSGKTNIVEALKALANNSGLQSSGHTIVVTNKDGVNNVEVNYNHNTLSADTQGIIGTNLKISASTASTTSGVARTYILCGEDGKQIGDAIKTINDVFLKSVEVAEKDGVKGLLFTWYVRTEEGEEPTTKTTFIPLTDLDSYKGGSGITIDDTTNYISVDLSTDANNILTLKGDGNDSKLYASAVTEVALNGKDLAVVNNKVDLGTVVSGISGTVGGEKFTAVITDGQAVIEVNPNASGVTFDPTETEKLYPSISGDNVQTIIEEVVKEMSEISDNSISGLSAISATTDASGNTEISLTLNKSNTTSQGDGIISSEIGATATASTTTEGPTNAVKMSQDKDNGLFVYVEIVGNDTEDEDEPTPQEIAMFYTSSETNPTSEALGITATIVND